MKLRYFLIISLMIHILPFVNFGGKGSEEQKPNTSEILDKPMEVTTSYEVSYDGESGPSKAVSKPSCKKFYIGIGVRFSEGITVGKVANGYPASRYGVQVGDKLINTYEIMVGEEGSVFRLYIDRNGERVKIDLPREKICVD